MLALAAACNGEPPPPTEVPADEPVAVASSSGPVAQRGAAFSIACFEAGLTNDDGTPATCEISAAATIEDRVVLFNDKPTPGAARSSVLTLDPDHPGSPQYELEPGFTPFFKFEDAAELGAGELLITTGFDRIHEADAAWDGFNGLLRWRRGAPVEVLAASIRDGVTSSRGLRAPLAAALADAVFPEGPAYFKVEGLAVDAGGRILLGIRELGATFEDFRFTVTILAADDLPALARGEVRRIWDYDPQQHPEVEHPLGLSGLGQDPARGGLWLTTSWELGETDEDLGGYLWWLPFEALDRSAPPQLVHDPAGVAISFAHKPEAVTVLADGRLLVVHDDDRVTGRPAASITDASEQFERGLHESPAEIIRPVDAGP
jgi:hypothetical protein